MKNRRVEIRCFTFCVSALLMVTTPVCADSVVNFILGDNSPAPTQRIDEGFTSSALASCMQCHDGNAAQDVGIKQAGSAITFSSHGSSGHPVGMSYERYAREVPTAYVNPAELDSRIKLDKGNVTCISCHEAKQSPVGANVEPLYGFNEMTNVCTSTKNFTTGLDRSRLCMSCHVK